MTSRLMRRVLKNGTKTIFRYESMPDFEKGVAQRRNIGPQGSELVYTLPFTKENAQKLFDYKGGITDSINCQE